MIKVKYWQTDETWEALQSFVLFSQFKTRLWNVEVLRLGLSGDVADKETWTECVIACSERSLWGVQLPIKKTKRNYSAVFNCSHQFLCVLLLRCQSFKPHCAVWTVRDLLVTSEDVLFPLLNWPAVYNYREQFLWHKWLQMARGLRAVFYLNLFFWHSVTVTWKNGHLQLTFIVIYFIKSYFF